MVSKERQIQDGSHHQDKPLEIDNIQIPTSLLFKANSCLIQAPAAMPEPVPEQVPEPNQGHRNQCDGTHHQDEPL